MTDLAKSLTGEPADWKPGSDPCKWSGVDCGGGEVVSVNLVSKSITGTLPSSLSQLSSLQELSLQGNSIGGPIPALPSSIQSVSLDNNQFTSIPPTFFSGLASLQEFTIDDNPLAQWNLSARDLAECTSLREFSASNASISGSIPDIFGQLSGLQDLRLSYNYLTGPLPNSFAGSAIKNLWLNNQKSAEKLAGPITVLGSMDQLSLVWLQSNSFAGPIPDLSNLTGLASFNVRDNVLAGVVPPSLVNSATLQNVSIANNNLQGPMPVFPTWVAAGSMPSNVLSATAAAAGRPLPMRWRRRESSEWWSCWGGWRRGGWLKNRETCSYSHTRFLIMRATLDATSRGQRCDLKSGVI